MTIVSHIPDVGSELELLEDWTFMLYRNENMDIAEIMHNVRGYNYSSRTSMAPATLPAGTVIKIRKYLMRTVNADYSQIVIVLKSTSDHRFMAPQIGKRKPKLKMAFKITVNLCDFNYGKFKVLSDPSLETEPYVVKK